ncbi:MAG TPA: hypothetical protein HPQ04_09905 [Rhodospirillaceae bacterium]|nr:hypothetical protein [Rhodospirillaceae bacterium]
MRGGSYTALHNGQGAGLRKKSTTRLSSSFRSGQEEKSWWWQWTLLAVIVGGTIMMVVGMTDHGASVPKAGDLVQQMELAVDGTVAPRNVFGGSLKVERSGGQITVTVEDLAPKVCVSAAWELARKGVVVINGVAPQRISAGRLSDLCNEQDSASLSWIVKPE